MNGPQHYHRAEQLLRSARIVSENDPQRASLYVARAQTHASLARVAAIVDTSHGEICNEGEWQARTDAEMGELW